MFKLFKYMEELPPASACQKNDMPRMESPTSCRTYDLTWDSLKPYGHSRGHGRVLREGR